MCFVRSWLLALCFLRQLADDHKTLKLFNKEQVDAVSTLDNKEMSTQSTRVRIQGFVLSNKHKQPDFTYPDSTVFDRKCQGKQIKDKLVKAHKELHIQSAKQTDKWS